MLVSLLHVIQNLFIPLFDLTCALLFSFFFPNFANLLLSQNVGIGLCQLPEISLFRLSAKGFAEKRQGYLCELLSTSCSVELHSCFCSPPTSTKFLGGVTHVRRLFVKQLAKQLAMLFIKKRHVTPLL